jgi:hypothetical protein
MKRTIAIVVLLLCCTSAFAARYPAGTPGTTNNGDSCDLGNFPAATLLLPYFEVDLDRPQQRTLLLTIANTSRQPQIAKVILWTDSGYPVLDFNIFLTGYDVQSLNLADILVRGVLARGTSIAEPQGRLSAGNAANPNFAANVAGACAPGILPGQIPASILSDMRAALTKGTAASCGTARIGGVHPFATGYATVDLVSTCSTRLPLDKSYWDELLYDNVLMGDYQQLGGDVEAGGNPLVHIRAVPEGGKPGEVAATNLPYTFYDRFTPRDGPRTRDRRQPLPATFAARFIEEPAFARPSGSGFRTSFKIWREGVTGPSADCRSYFWNHETATAEMTRFDEHENPTTYAPSVIGLIPDIVFVPLPLASKTTTSNTGVFPPFSSGDEGGWLYLNLSNGGSSDYSVAQGRRFAESPNLPRQSQNWVVVTMTNGRFTTDADATALGNGCSPAPALSIARNGTATIGPLPDANP